MTRYLVTGAQGFLGRYLIAHLLATDPEAIVFGVGRSPRNDLALTHAIFLGNESILAPLPAELSPTGDNKRYQYFAQDLRQLSPLVTLLRQLQPQVVFHLASALRDEPVDALFQNNVEGSVRLLQATAAAQLGEMRVVMASSGGVYGMPEVDALPLSETASCRPNDLYSVSKLAAEHAAILLARQTGARLVIGRLFNILGAGQDERHVCGRIMSQLTAILAERAEKIVKIGSLDTTRDFIDCRDAAAALAMLAHHGQAEQVYNIASGVETSIADVLNTSLELAQLQGLVDVRRLAPRPTDIPRHYASIDRLLALGYTPRYTLRQSLSSILDYYQNCWQQCAATRSN